MRLIAYLALVLTLATPALADSGLYKFWPAIPQGTGEPHPQGNEFMRKYHMELMKHDRDLTMYDGIRDVDASLKQCFDCHAVQDAATGQPVTNADDRHFCRVCHDYAAVKVDCFMCHRSTPEGFEEPQPLHGRLLDLQPGPEAAEIIAWLAQQD